VRAVVSHSKPERETNCLEREMQCGVASAGERIDYGHGERERDYDLIKWG
jgi:hypothetical protein